MSPYVRRLRRWYKNVADGMQLFVETEIGEKGPPKLLISLLRILGINSMSIFQENAMACSF